MTAVPCESFTTVGIIRHCAGFASQEFGRADKPGFEFPTLQATIRQSNEPQIKKNNRFEHSGGDSSQRILRGVKKPTG
jgi:hypothetical protein